mmetsp:Transcript_7074/g.8955  ORF Transcript_7074/g.8955 Transcript_7074/m.8955 type:complete len:88 (-) Transcript_7074:1301-1564(-)
MASIEREEQAGVLLIGLWFVLSLGACILLIAAAWVIVWKCVLEKIPTVQELFGNKSKGRSLNNPKTERKKKNDTANYNYSQSNKKVA